MPKPDDGLERIAVLARTGNARSPLFRWLLARHDAFAALLAEGRPNWSLLAEGFTAEGLTNGRPLTGETARRTWWKARRAHAKAEARRAAARAKAGKAPEVRMVAAERPPPAAAPERPPDASDGMAELRRQMDQRSGRV